MAKGIFITGTDTGVGKTVITGGLLAVLNKNGIKTAALKPVQTGGIPDAGGLISEDARFYRVAAGLPGPLRDMNTYCLEPALSPNVAARISGQAIEPEKIRDDYNRLAGEHEVVLVEGAGGIAVPLAGCDFTMAHLARCLGTPLLVVARPGLGTINHTVLTVSYARQAGLEVLGVVINGHREAAATLAERTNPGVIQAMTGVPVLGIVPYLDGVSVEACEAAGLAAVVEERVDWRLLLERGGDR